MLKHYDTCLEIEYNKNPPLSDRETRQSFRQVSGQRRGDSDLNKLCIHEEVSLLEKSTKKGSVREVSRRGVERRRARGGRR